MTSTDITSQIADRGEAEIRPATVVDTGKGTMIAVTAIFVGLLTAGAYATVTGIGDWSQLVVLGGIALVAIATMIAVDPMRREP